jgi:hypothetical protein
MSVETSAKNLRATESIRVCVFWRLPGRETKSSATLIIHHGRVQSSQMKLSQLKTALFWSDLAARNRLSNQKVGGVR